MSTSLQSRPILDTLFPPVTTNMCRVMQPTLYRYVWRVSASQQIRLCILTILVFPLSMAPLELQRLMVNRALEKVDMELMFSLGMIYLAVLIVHGSFKYALNVFQGRVGEGVIRVLRMRVAGEGREDPQRGAKVSMVAAETESIGEFVGEAICFPLRQIGIFLAVFGYMVWLQPLMALVAILFIGPSVVVVTRIQIVINRHVQKRTRLVREIGNQISNEEDTPADEDADKQFNGLIDRVYHTRVRIFVLKYLAKALNNLFNGLGPLSILLVGGWLVIEGRTEVGTIVAFISGFERLTDPARELLNFFRRLSQSRVQYRLLADAFS